MPSGPIYSIDQAFADPQAKSLGMVQKVGDVPLPRPTGDALATPSHAYAHPPKQGEHTDSVLHELGYKDGEIADLRKKGIV